MIGQRLSKKKVELTLMLSLVLVRQNKRTPMKSRIISYFMGVCFNWHILLFKNKGKLMIPVHNIV